MFPIGDDNSDRTIVPVVNYALIGLNLLVFVILQQLGGNDAFTYAFSLVPREIVTGIDLTTPVVLRDQAGRVLGEIPQYATPVSVYFNFLSSMFMHGSIAHIAGNMLFLWVFGDNIENLLGHFRYAAFYILCGLGAAAAQIAMDSDSVIPMLGASGAISGVLGGYVLLFPRRAVRAIVFNFLTTVPAFVAIGIWIGYQLLLGFLTPSGVGGVAYAAHIGGFAVGIATIWIFAYGKQAPSKRLY
ncbi:MAG: rhomboid family intramembrane serine protease [Acidobacteria bacterium]|nr:rhomboid family intramembrane serine protease [Acidobacteriota bacterium]MCW5948020.1 rhomboid family intramembrane serine protease [Pyrinomonadaceae bacterium]